MRYRILLCMLFTALMILCPMLAVQDGFQAPMLPPSQPRPITEQPSQQGEAMPDETPAITETGDEALETGISYDGTPDVYTPPTDGFKLLNLSTGKTFEVDARTFVRGALASEMPPDFHSEALKAQAVAAHTYALYAQQMQADYPDKSLKGACLTADPDNFKSFTTEEAFFERYGDYAPAYWQQICAAADAVCDYALLYEGQPALTAYHSMSAGMTEDAVNVWNGGLSYLTPVESRGDTLAPDYKSVSKFSASEIAGALRAAAPDAALGESASGWLEITERSPSGYVTQVRVGQSSYLTGLQLRELLGLRSSNFTFETDGSSFTFTTLGYGHGVGLSQYGADYLARQGMSFDQILAHYYPGTSLALLRAKR